MSGDGAICDDGDACTALDVCQGGACIHLAAPVDDGDPDTLDACFPELGVKHADCSPSQVDAALPVPLAVQVACLYIDPDPESDTSDPIQQGVDCDPSTPAVAEPCLSGLDPLSLAAPFHPAKVALLRGRVQDPDGAPLPGAAVWVLGHPELGWTVSRADGWYDLAVTGGGPLTVAVWKAGYLESQRTKPTAWQTVTVYPDVALLPLDPAVTPVDATSDDPNGQVVLGSPSEDLRGKRQAMVIFPQGTATGTLVFADGHTEPLASQFHARITEYTVGERGPERMPADLPPSSAYTYAFELTVDEAEAVGAVRVEWSGPVGFVVEERALVAAPREERGLVGEDTAGLGHGAALGQACAS